MPLGVNHHRALLQGFGRGDLHLSRPKVNLVSNSASATDGWAGTLGKSFTLSDPQFPCL